MAKLSTADERAWFNLGKIAYALGDSFGECPAESVPHRDAWEKGWLRGYEYLRPTPETALPATIKKREDMRCELRRYLAL